MRKYHRWAPKLNLEISRQLSDDSLLKLAKCELYFSCVKTVVFVILRLFDGGAPELLMSTPSDVADVEINIGSQSLVMTKVNL